MFPARETNLVDGAAESAPNGAAGRTIDANLAGVCRQSASRQPVTTRRYGRKLQPHAPCFRASRRSGSDGALDRHPGQRRQGCETRGAGAVFVEGRRIAQQD